MLLTLFLNSEKLMILIKLIPSFTSYKGSGTKIINKNISSLFKNSH